MFDRKECRFPGCDRRGWKHEMAKVKWYSGVSNCWVTAWVCRKHIDHDLVR